MMDRDRFERCERLLGTRGLEHLGRAVVAVVGLGVTSYASAAAVGKTNSNIVSKRAIPSHENGFLNFIGASWWCSPVI